MSVTVAAAGVDTSSLCWYVDRDSMAAGALDELATVSSARGALLPEQVAGHRIGWNRGVGMLYAEGHPSPDGLCPAGDLPAARDVLVAAMLDRGIPVPPGVTADMWEPGDDLNRPNRQAGFAGVRRLDSTMDLRCGPAEGLAILAGVAAVIRDAPRSLAQVYFAPDGPAVATVYMHGSRGGKVLGRWYDKGREAGTAQPGALIRPEDQRRFVKGTRRDVEELSAEYVRSKFHQRFLPLWQASKGVIVAGPIVLAQQLAQRVEAGDLTPAQADDLAGFLLMEAVQMPRPTRTRERRRAKVRELGLVVADGVLQEVEIRLDDVLEQCMDASAWGCDQ